MLEFIEETLVVWGAGQIGWSVQKTTHESQVCLSVSPNLKDRLNKMRDMVLPDREWRTYFFHRLFDTNLVVYIHDGYKRSIRSKCFLKILK